MSSSSQAPSQKSTSQKSKKKNGGMSGHTASGQSGKDRSGNGQSSNGQSSNGQSGNGQSGNGQSNNGQGGRAVSGRAQAGPASADIILDALRDLPEESSSFAASSAALQAANSVMLANMRARLGKETPTPSAVYAQAIAHNQPLQPSILSASATAPSTVPEVTLTPLAPAATPTPTTPEAPATESAFVAKDAGTPSMSSPAPAADHTADVAPAFLPERTIAAAVAEVRTLPAQDDAQAAPSPFSPFAFSTDTDAGASPILAVAHAGGSSDLSPARERTPSPVSAFGQSGRNAPSDAPLFDTVDFMQAPASPLEANESSTAAEVELAHPVDTQHYAEATEHTYREWQGALPPAQRSWHRVAMITVLVLAVGINLFFFLRSGPNEPAVGEQTVGGPVTGERRSVLADLPVAARETSRETNDTVRIETARVSETSANRAGAPAAAGEKGEGENAGGLSALLPLPEAEPDRAMERVTEQATSASSARLPLPPTSAMQPASVSSDDRVPGRSDPQQWLRVLSRP